jgi:1-hydroxycarotenoid 3,4-desaturase
LTDANTSIWNFNRFSDGAGIIDGHARRQGVIVVGAGIGGLACAIDLAARGVEVTILERAATVGGKLRQARLGEHAIDCGPTVFTMRWVFEELFAAAGASFADHLTLSPLSVLARHAWDDSEHFDLFADLETATDAVGRFAGAAEAKHFRSFSAEAEKIYRTLREPFLASSKPGPITLARRIGLSRPAALFGIRPFASLWGALGQHFQDPRLRQLFGRYATYSGSSPFSAPATLMLIAHVERDGVWKIAGGMVALAHGLRDFALSLGVTIRCGESVAEILVSSGAVRGVRLQSGESLMAPAIVLNADAAALADGLFGAAVRHAAAPVARSARSLSATTWAMVAQSDGFPLAHHNVFFSGDYRAEFDDLLKQSKLPEDPTVYVCAQDRGGEDQAVHGPERLLLLVNAPAIGDQRPFPSKEISTCEKNMLDRLQKCGLRLSFTEQSRQITSPADFNTLFPATGGALYGRASHGWRASFQRPSANSRIPGLYLAGGSTHPGAGVPMAALSGRLAAARLLADQASTRRFHPGAIFGGISTG